MYSVEYNKRNETRYKLLKVSSEKILGVLYTGHYVFVVVLKPDIPLYWRVLSI